MNLLVGIMWMPNPMRKFMMNIKGLNIIFQHPEIGLMIPMYLELFYINFRVQFI